MPAVAFATGFGSEGAQVHETLRSRADSLRDQIRTDNLARAEGVTSRLDIPGSLLVFVLLGFAVYPFLAYEVLADLIRTGEVLGDLYEVFKHYRKGISKGLLKILSKMGISTIASYRGAQLFEAVGLADEVVDLSFRGVASRIQGARFVDIEAEQKLLAQEAWNNRRPIQQGGLLKFVYGGEYHAYNPDVVNALQAWSNVEREPIFERGDVLYDVSRLVLSLEG